MALFSNTDLEFRTEVDTFKMPIKRFDGYDHTFWSFVPDNIDAHLAGIREADVRPDDVYICTYPRSGTSWTNEIVSMLVNSRADYVNPDHFLEWLDIMTKQYMSEMTSPRIFVSHLPYELLPSQLTTKGRVICVFRNPKDVAASFYNYTRDVNFADFDGSFDDYLRLFYNGDVPSGSWFKHVKDWEKVGEDRMVNSLLQIHYEDLSKNLRSSVENIAKFLDVKDDNELITDIVEKCSFINMVNEKKSNVPTIISSFSKDKGNYLYRRGKVGDWKNWFTVAQSEQFDMLYKEQMKESKLSFMYSL